MDFMYDIVLPNLREIPGGVCACKKQNKVFFSGAWFDHEVGSCRRNLFQEQYRGAARDLSI